MTTKTQAINDFCKSCIYDPYSEGTWRAQVAECPSKSCSLYEYRPVDEKTALKRKEKRLENMTEQERTYYETKCRESAKKLRKTA